MADQHTMAELLRAPTEGYAKAILVPPIPAEHFELKHSLINLCPAIDGNTFLGYQDNIQEYVSAAAVNYNQGNTGFGPQHPQVEPPNEFTTYKKITKTSSRAMQNRITNLKAEMKNEIHSLMQNHINNVKNELRNDMSNQTNELRNMMARFFQKNTDSTLGSRSLPNNTIANPRGDLEATTTRSGVSYDGPHIPLPFLSLPKVVERVPEVTKDTVQPSTKNIQPPVVQIQVLIDEPVVAPNPKPTIHYPSRVTKQKLREKDDNLALKFVEIFRKLHFDLTTTPVNENYSAVILKKLPEKLGDHDKFLIPCNFLELVECLALVDLGASINLMPLSIWKKLSLLELTPTRMILELADRSTTQPAGIAKDVFVKVGKFHFPIDFVVIDYVVDPRVPLILGRPFFRTRRALIDVYGEELTLCVNDEAITFKVGQTSKYSYNDAELINRFDVIDIACEEYVQEVLGFFDNSKSGNPTPISDLIIALSSPSLTPFKGGDFILEEIEACLTSKLVPQRIDDIDFALEGDIQETDKLPVIISKELKYKEKSALLKVLKSHKREIAWKISDIMGIDPRFCTHKILMEDDFKPMVQHQRRANLKIHEVIKKEVIKLFDAGLIYLIFNSPWVSPVHCVPKKGGMTVIEHEDNELIPPRLVTGMFQRCMMAIFHDMNKETMEVFMDDFLVFGDSFSLCLSHLDKMLKRCKDPNLVLNWGKCNFMVKEGIVLSHKISKFGIKVNRAKVDVIAKLPHSTFINGV
nr:DNA-directed DNA polymerase [Tanacetum cinerariifolium]